MNTRDALIYLLIFLYSISVASADSIIGCGGFVEASSSLVKSRKPTDSKLDYSSITVELRTLDDLVKDRTQCAPNGYYFIPVYDKGSFILKINGPYGWSWDPEKVPVTIDDNGCNHNEDINFRFTGFTISGSVLGAVGGQSCSLKDGGPSNVKVELLTPADDLISSVSTTSTGSYLFINILPGKYKLRASHPDSKVEVRGSTEVELGFENYVVDDIFVVTGYDLRGFVVSQGNPILGVHVVLYSDDVLEIECPQGSGAIPGQRQPLCHAVSDADGMFSFKSVPCGLYELVPYYKGEHTVFDVSPSVVSVSVEHQLLTVPQKFQVTGFSVGGRVVDGNDLGVEGVKITVDGYERSITDDEGHYKLDQVTSRQYTIEARKERYKFECLKDYSVLPNMTSIKDIKAIAYGVCGVVRMATAGHKAKVALTHGPENVKPQVKYTDASGKFCFEVQPGEYRLSALAATPEAASGLLFLPSFHDVVVKSPLSDVVFSQALVNVRGSVTCKENCGPAVSVSLVRSTGKSKDEKKLVSLTDESDQFHFRDIIPGKYRLEVMHKHHESMSSEDNWCWEKRFIDVDVGSEDVDRIEFVQKGYWVNVFSTHDVDAYMTQPDGISTNLKIKKGSQRLCVETPGVHELEFVDSCISFGTSSKKVDTSNPEAVYLRGEKYLVKGQINFETSTADVTYESPQNITVDIRNSENTSIGSTTAILLSGADHQTSTVVYEYSTWANLGEKLLFVPQDTRNGAKKVLFYPRQHLVSVTKDSCQASALPFSGRPGIYIEGSITPAISDVYIKIIAAEDSQISSLRKGKIALETTTGTDGSFVGGPLYDDITYVVEASRAGYYLKRVGDHFFSGQKLGQISIHITSKDNAREPIPSVLLSLSGDDGYRNNSVSGAGGSFLFDNLFPGNFYLRPLLKEYAFSPATHAIDLASAESVEVTFEATRVAYSAMGMVTLLSGLPKEGASVEARSESKGYYEETVTDSSGTYRLRGLQPDTIYVIKVAEKGCSTGPPIELASPEFLTVKVGYKDISGLDFLVFEQPEKTILSGHVEGEGLKELHYHLLIEIKSASDTSKIESVFPLPISNFFQVKDLPKGKLLVQLKPSIPLSTHKFESEVVEVDLEKNPQIHVGPLRYKVEEDHHKQELTTAPVLPLVAGISVILLFISMPRLKDLFEATVGIPAPGFIASAKKELRKPVVRKKMH